MGATGSGLWEARECGAWEFRVREGNIWLGSKIGLFLCLYERIRGPRRGGGVPWFIGTVGVGYDDDDVYFLYDVMKWGL